MTNKKTNEQGNKKTDTKKSDKYSLSNKTQYQQMKIYPKIISFLSSIDTEEVFMEYKGDLNRLCSLVDEAVNNEDLSTEKRDYYTRLGLLHSGDIESYFRFNIEKFQELYDLARKSYEFGPKFIEIRGRKRNMEKDNLF
ncbi:MAG: hypothetical protein ACP5NV_03550 [Candidatus Woesearchaeota archaeon]